MRWLFAVALCLLLMLRPARADNAQAPGTIVSDLKTEQRVTPRFEINFYPQYYPTSYESLMPERTAPGIRYLYRGLQGVLARQAERFYYRYRGEYLRGLYGSQASMFDLEREAELFANGEADLATGGRWWERSWQDSLVPERDGAPETPEVCYGERIEIVDWGWISLSNEGKITVYDWFLRLDAKKVLPEGNQQQPAPEPLTRSVGLRIGSLRDGLLPKELARYVDVKVRPTVRVQLPTAADPSPIANVAVNVEARIMPDGKHLFAIFSARAEYNRNGEFSATFNLNILAW